MNDANSGRFDDGDRVRTTTPIDATGEPSPSDVATVPAGATGTVRATSGSARYLHVTFDDAGDWIVAAPSIVAAPDADPADGDGGDDDGPRRTLSHGIEPEWAPAPDAGTLADSTGCAFPDATWATRAIAERIADLVRRTGYGDRFRFPIPDGVDPSDVGGRVADDPQADREGWDVAWTDGAVFVRVPHRTL